MTVNTIKSCSVYRIKQGLMSDGSLPAGALVTVITASINPGWNSFTTELLFGNKIHKIFFVSEKHATDYLELILDEE